MKTMTRCMPSINPSLSQEEIHYFFEPMRVVPFNSTPVTMVHHTKELPVGKILFKWGKKYSNRETLMINIRQAQ